MANRLQHVQELVYVPNAVTHMLTGKATARAVRAHILNAVLNSLLLGSCWECLYLQSSSDHEEDEAVPEEFAGGNRDLDEAYALYESLMEKEISVNEACNADIIQRITLLLDETIASLKYSRTASLWLQYMNMIDILRQYIWAEHSGNWALHLEAISKMLPFLAASGNNHYTKSAWVYLQQPSQVEK